MKGHGERLPQTLSIRQKKVVSSPSAPSADSGNIKHFSKCRDVALHDRQLRQAQCLWFDSLQASPPCSLTWLAFGSLQPISAIPAWHTRHAWQAWSPIAALGGISGHCRPQVQR